MRRKINVIFEKLFQATVLLHLSTYDEIQIISCISSNLADLLQLAATNFIYSYPLHLLPPLRFKNWMTVYL